MSVSVYFFGQIAGKVRYYPQDHTRAIFDGAIARVRNVQQIVVHRSGDLLYYCYLRRIDDGDIFGVGLCLDGIFTDMDFLFGTFVNVYAEAIKDGALLKIDVKGRISWATSDLFTVAVRICEYSRKLSDSVIASNLYTVGLPPMDFSISINDCIELSLENDSDEILPATKRYTNLYITRAASEIELVTSVNSLLRAKDKEIDRIRKRLKSVERSTADLKVENIALRAKQKNIIWVGVLGVALAVMSVILYFKVINPSEVTHYVTDKFIYYGPLKNKKPHGVGVAIYPSDDKEERKFYIGNFTNGERNDTAAFLLYKHGDYFYGAMNGDVLKEGLFYGSSDTTYFKGVFRNNDTYDGAWYKCVLKHHVIKGQTMYESEDSPSNF